MLIIRMIQHGISAMKRFINSSTRKKPIKQNKGSNNKVILVGNLTRDPEMKQTEGKKPVCIIGLATNRHWTDQNGKKHEEPEYHRLIAWNKLAHLYRTRREEKTGVEVVLEKLEMLDSMPKDVKQTMDLQDALADT